MKAKILYVGQVDTIIEIKELNFENFCKDLFRKKIYLIIEKGKNKSVAINTRNIILVEELK